MTTIVIYRLPTEQLTEVFGPFTNAAAAEQWCNKLKDDPQYADVELCITELSDPTNVVYSTECEICGEPAVCKVPCRLVSEYEDLSGDVVMCRQCANDDDIDISKYPL